MGKLFCNWVTWPDLVTWPHMALGLNFHKSCGKDGGKVGENPAALRAAVFSLSSKNLRGGGAFKRPPSRARVNSLVSGWYSLLVEDMWAGQRLQTVAGLLSERLVADGAVQLHLLGQHGGQPLLQAGVLVVAQRRVDSRQVLVSVPQQQLQRWNGHGRRPGQSSEVSRWSAVGNTAAAVITRSFTDRCGGRFSLLTFESSIDTGLTLFLYACESY